MSPVKVSCKTKTSGIHVMMSVSGMSENNCNAVLILSYER
jgi:3-methyladenine DNA glycosylase Mpg